ncbi:NUDIX domain-containing protein [Geodermatophilus sabuli]|uniref:NUDIX domain-containing protein n=1 Tax=Geodermatophilus sabuli TaxID=1564158 RepID=A0A7K3VZM8_9ACTN|nr:NUDIX domain-containing protein [Geodermatophilus sabuli]
MLVHRVVAGVLVRGARVLLAHRSPGRRWYPDVWDFPGGHVEGGEDERAALARELREEIGVDPREVDAEPVLRAEDAGLRLSVWAVRSWQGEPRNLQPDEHDDLRWVSAAEVRLLRLAHPAHVAVVDRLVGRPDGPEAG